MNIGAGSATRLSFAKSAGPRSKSTTPYLDRHNDQLQIYATKTNGHFALTDDGYIIQDLQSSGCDLKTERRRTLSEKPRLMASACI